MNSNVRERYEAQRRQEMVTADRKTVPFILTSPDTVGAWRFKRVYNLLLPIISAEPESTWLTIGDGNFGTDAHYLESHGIDVTASSLTDETLKEAREQGIIKKYAVANAEKIPFDDNAFDYILCKEAYHHFPRPPIAFYEMMRVARKGVILIEPNEGPQRLLECIKQPAKKLLWGKNETIHFEPSGNYIYRISPKQIGKKMSAMGYGMIAHKVLNDIYLPKHARAKLGASKGYVSTRMAIASLNILSTLRLINPTLVMVTAFKLPPSPHLMKKMKQAGLSLSVLPKNPYI